MRLLGLFCGFLVAICSPANAAEWTYINPFDGSKFFEIDDTRNVVTLNDLRYHSVPCKDPRLEFCVITPVFSFAIPINIESRSHGSWGVHNMKFQLVGSRKVRILGNAHKVLAVRSSQNGGQFEFLYSDTDGLIGFSVSDGHATSLYLSTRGRGYGAKGD